MKLNNNLRLLVIDDNPAIHQDFFKILSFTKPSDELIELDEKIFGQQSLSKNLTTLPKFQIDSASQGEEGIMLIEKAMSEENPYALAFVDIRMPPGLDGIETIKRIWQLDGDIQIVICTAYSDYSWEKTAEQLGITDNLLILKKPFDNIAVRQLACALTKKWQLLKNYKEQAQFLEESIKERTQSLQASLSLTKATLESSKDGILVVSTDNEVVDYNKQFIEIFNIPNSVIETKKIEPMIEYILDQLNEPNKLLNKIKNSESDEGYRPFDIIKFKDGRIYELHFQPHRLGKKTVGRVWSFRDVTSRNYLESQLEYQATHDSLTDLPNRALLTDRIRHTIGIAQRNGSSIGILYIDLDRFKLINDSLSHFYGDQLLQIISKRLLSITRTEDTVARLGGDEFVLIAPISGDKKNIINLAKKVLCCIKKSFYIKSRKIVISASIGISIYPDDGKTAEELLGAADLAMYHAKNSGSDQFQFYTGKMNKIALARFEKELDLRHAIENNEFFLCYQPQFDVSTEKIISVEALIRWNHPQKGILSPLDFIPLAEETGLIIPIGEWVFKTACKQNKIWQDSGLTPMRMAVNVTAQQFRQPHFVNWIKNLLDEVGLKPEYLEIEITENVIITSFGVVEVINNLKSMGIQITLDDFGTGNSSLNYLKKIHLDRLKIDQSFIRNINLDRSDEVITEAIITIAHGLNLEVFAEGVETKNQLNFLQKKHCQNIQGFYFSKPLNSQECETLLRQNRKKGGSSGPY